MTSFVMSFSRNLVLSVLFFFFILRFLGKIVLELGIACRVSFVQWGEWRRSENARASYPSLFFLFFLGGGIAALWACAASYLGLSLLPRGFNPHIERAGKGEFRDWPRCEGEQTNVIRFLIRMINDKTFCRLFSYEINTKTKFSYFGRAIF